MAQKSLDPRTINKIYELFETGSTIVEIVNKVGTNRETVHHINGNNSDNRIANLQLTTFSEDISRHNLAKFEVIRDNLYRNFHPR